VIAGEEPHAETYLNDSNLASKIEEQGIHPQLPSNSPEWADDLAELCFAKYPEDRPSMKTIRTILAGVVEGKTVSEMYKSRKMITDEEEDEYLQRGDPQEDENDRYPLRRDSPNFLKARDNSLTEKIKQMEQQLFTEQEKSKRLNEEKEELNSTIKSMEDVTKGLRQQITDLGVESNQKSNTIKSLKSEKQDLESKYFQANEYSMKVNEENAKLRKLLTQLSDLKLVPSMSSQGSLNDSLQTNLSYDQY